MGDSAYERMVELLEEVGRPRFPMPGQRVNRGRPLIPLILAERFPNQ